MEAIKAAFELGAAFGAGVVGFLLVLALGGFLLAFLWDLRP